MGTDVILEVLLTLIGNVEPAGATHIDNERIKNLEKMAKIHDELDRYLRDIVYEYDYCHEASIKRAVKVCKDQLERVHNNHKEDFETWKQNT